ncbi:SAM-dependent methlyltransferase [Dehalococcoides mccartyi]|uniref:class I SAM-dependent RNA methyltransferase n=1 Tax=Dehalococcoides mccartyi TaxID=61435 RepID=UPI0002B773E5|nr:class I SAM-dependent RNA methyltransferase [Dehalococcoides mccartyi]AGG08096.1 RNA methyltransferase, TrmA family [Dehalococcoides mccartyi BTF08]KSV17525.1 SAM-dependent methlyltransferase [Dehalococcoides mccartyi]
MNETAPEIIENVRLEEGLNFGLTSASLPNRTLEVFGGIQGETVDIRLFAHKAGRGYAQVIKAHTPSSERVIPSCPYFGDCTGCTFQHINYIHQLQLKHRIVTAEFEKAELFGIDISPVVPSDEESGYRNHARLSIYHANLGFVNRFSRRHIQIDHCRIMNPGINKVLAVLQGKCGETRQISIRYGSNKDSYLIQPKLVKANVDIESGQKEYHDILLGHDFCISAASFFQVNNPQAEKMANLIKNHLNLSGSETLVDAYAGVGTFAVLLSPDCKRVIAIEESAAAVKDACLNISGIDNIELIQSKTEDVINQFEGQMDALILDPSRSGAHPSVLATICQNPPRNLVYVACDPSSLARDLKILLAGPFELSSVIPVDMFPQTYHVETLALLKCKL